VPLITVLLSFPLLQQAGEKCLLSTQRPKLLGESRPPPPLQLITALRPGGSPPAVGRAGERTLPRRRGPTEGQTLRLLPQHCANQVRAWRARGEEAGGAKAERAAFCRGFETALLVFCVLRQSLTSMIPFSLIFQIPDSYKNTNISKFKYSLRVFLCTSKAVW